MGELTRLGVILRGMGLTPEELQRQAALRTFRRRLVAGLPGALPKQNGANTRAGGER